MKCRSFVLLVLILNILYAAGRSTTARQIGLGWKAGFVPAPSTETDRLAALCLRNLVANEADDLGQASCSIVDAAIWKE